MVFDEVYGLLSTFLLISMLCQVPSLVEIAQGSRLGRTRPISPNTSLSATMTNSRSSLVCSEGVEVLDDEHPAVEIFRPGITQPKRKSR